MNDKDGYFVFRPVAETSGVDGSGYRVLKYVTHTFGYTPEEYAQMHRESGTLIFCKISDAIVMAVQTRTIPEKTEVISALMADPITDLRWME